MKRRSSMTRLCALLFCMLCFSSTVNGSDASLIRLATTTSTDNSGLLNYLLPEFTANTGYKVHVIAVGTGKALRLGQDGDVDVVLVHALNAEQAFVDAGYGLKRHPVMYNDFVIVGPRNDPAGVLKDNTIDAAFKHISSSQSLFISRGDNSGTHKKELSIWKAAGLEASGSWYREVGQGMGKVLQMANELDAYTITDRGTWLAYEKKVELKIVFQGDSALFNPYGIIAVNPARYPDINIAGATALIDWMTSKKGQRMIGDFKISGQQLFIPSAH